jgi:hypothetical protein
MLSAKVTLPSASSPPLEVFAAGVGKDVPIEEEAGEIAVVDGEDDVVVKGVEDVADTVEHVGLPPHPVAMIWSSVMLISPAYSSQILTKR